ncbi:MAG: hypothetical protein RIC55_14200 [Pirellulaceae bacterium]
MATKKDLAAQATIEETVFRVYSMPEEVRERMVKAREAKGETSQLFLATVIDQQLPNIVSGLKALGVSAPSESRRPARLPMCDSMLAELRLASEATGLPASTLLLACINLAAVPATNTQKRRRTPRKGTTTKKATRSRKGRK